MSKLANTRVVPVIFFCFSLSFFSAHWSEACNSGHDIAHCFKKANSEASLLVYKLTPCCCFSEPEVISFLPAGTVQCKYLIGQSSINQVQTRHLNGEKGDLSDFLLHDHLWVLQIIGQKWEDFLWSVFFCCLFNARGQRGTQQGLK